MRWKMKPIKNEFHFDFPVNPQEKFAGVVVRVECITPVPSLPLTPFALIRVLRKVRYAVPLNGEGELRVWMQREIINPTCASQAEHLPLWGEAGGGRSALLPSILDKAPKGEL